MARRGGGAKKAARGKRRRDAELEVEETGAPAAPQTRDGFETSLLVGAFVALLLTFIMLQMKLSSDYGAGLFG